jgi:CRP/FNR family transcriptional regulator
MLQTVPLFSQLSAQETTRMARSALLRRFQAGQVIAWAEEPCQELYVLQSGTVRIFRLSPDGREQVLQVTRPGDVFAGAPVFCGCTLPSTCQAQDDVNLIVIPGGDLLHLVEAHPYIAMRILGLCCARMRRLTSLAAELSSKNIVRRLAWLLLDSCSCVHSQMQGGICRLTEEQIAARLGSTQETISRALAQLRERGIVQTRRQEVTVSDLAALRRVATGLEPDL